MGRTTDKSERRVTRSLFSLFVVFALSLLRLLFVVVTSLDKKEKEKVPLLFFIISLGPIEVDYSYVIIIVSMAMTRLVDYECSCGGERTQLS